jgi:hypothetical protein
METVKKRRDAFSRRSAMSLKREINKQMTHIFVTALECIEIRFGRDFEGYNELRSKILRVGNDSKRNLEQAIDSGFNVEKIPHCTVVNTKGQVKTERSNNGQQ